MLTRWRDVIAPILIAIVTTIWFGHVLFGGQAFYTRDMLGYHYPMKKIVRDRMLSGEILPQWSPWFGAGQPLAANPAYELFYPPQWLVLLPDFHFGMSLHIVFHFYLCAIGLYFLIRSFGAGSIAATLGAVGFTLGGPMISLIRTLPLLFSLAWAPLIFLFARRFLLTRSRRDFLLAALCGGMQALVAEPTTLIQTWMIVAAYAGYRVLHERQDRAGLARAMAIGVALLGLASLLVAAAQVVPMLDFIPDSVRSQPFPFADLVASWSMTPSRPLEMYYPLLFQSLYNQAGIPWISTMYPLGETFVSSFYFGCALAIFFTAGILAWRKGSGFVLALCVVLYILAIGANTPLLRILYDIGIFKSLRYPEKFALGAALVAAIWGALTLDRIFRGDRRTLRMAIFVTLGWFGFGLLLLVAAYSAWKLFWVITFARGVILLALLLAMRRWPVRAGALGAALVVLTIFDVAHLRRSVNPTIGTGYFEPPPVTRQLPPEKDQYRVFHIGEWDWKYSMPHADVFFINPMGRWWSLRNSLMTRNGAYWGYRYALETDYDQTFLTPTAELVLAMRFLKEANRPGWEEPLMAMSNAWYKANFRPFASEAERTNTRWEEMMPVDFTAAPERYPRYYFADRIETIAGRDDFVARLMGEPWSPRVAFIETAPFQPATGTVGSVDEQPERIRIEAQSEGRSLLVISMTPHKYWRATVNGRAAELRPVNIGYQGLELPAGRHAIELTYRNPLLVPSMIVSLLAVIGVIVGCVIFPHVPLREHVGSPVSSPGHGGGAEAGGSPQKRKRRKRNNPG